MPWYLTEYEPNWRKMSKEGRSGTTYSAYLWARNPRHAVSVAKDRGMGEIIISDGFKNRPHRTASEILASRASLKEKGHALCFLCMIGMASGVISAQDAIGDKGVIHELMHHMTPKRRKALIERVKSMERIVPGYLSGEEPVK